jgi:gamma-tubulin complex component 5
VCNPQKPPGPLTWTEILAEEPFHGQHWEGVYGLPPGSTVEGWEVRSNGSSPSLSPWDDDHSRDDGSDSLSLAGSLSSMKFEENEGPSPIEGGRSDDNIILKAVPEFYRHRQAFEELQARQYWRPEWRTQADLDRPFNLGDHSTLAPSLDKVQKGSTLGIFGTTAHEVRHP